MSSVYVPEFREGIELWVGRYSRYYWNCINMAEEKKFSGEILEVNCHVTVFYLSLVWVRIFRGLACCSYGRVDELVYFASLKEQHEIVVHHYIQVTFFLHFVSPVCVCVWVVWGVFCLSDLISMLLCLCVCLFIFLWLFIYWYHGLWSVGWCLEFRCYNL